jgi:hypothetical protein
LGAGNGSFDADLSKTRLGLLKFTPAQPKEGGFECNGDFAAFCDQTGNAVVAEIAPEGSNREGFPFGFPSKCGLNFFAPWPISK